MGAGIGELSLYFMKMHGPGCVFAFEPLETARNAFRRNLAANGWSSSDLDLSAAFSGTGSESVSLDSIPVNRGQHGFIKIDVDGAELDVLHSAPELLNSRAADLLVEVHSKTLERHCHELLRAAGYGVSIVDNAWWRVIIPEKRPVEHNRWLVAQA